MCGQNATHVYLGTGVKLTRALQMWDVIELCLKSWHMLAGFAVFKSNLELTCSGEL